MTRPWTNMDELTHELRNTRNRRAAVVLVATWRGERGTDHEPANDPVELLPSDEESRRIVAAGGRALLASLKPMGAIAPRPGRKAVR